MSMITLEEAQELPQASLYEQLTSLLRTMSWEDKRRVFRPNYAAGKVVSRDVVTARTLHIRLRSYHNRERR